MATVDGIDLPAGAEADATGEWAVWHDFNELNEQALHKAELLSGPADGHPAVRRVRLGDRRRPPARCSPSPASPSASPLLHLGTGVTPLSVWSMNFSMMIGLAVGIDYSLFIVSRYREEREDGKDAARRGRRDAWPPPARPCSSPPSPSCCRWRPIFLVPVMVFRSMALGMILSVVATAAASLTLLPAVLVALGDRVLVAKGHDDPDRAAEGRWARWTGDGACAGPAPPSPPGSACCCCSPAPPSACASACPPPASSTPATRAATATTPWSSTSAPGAAAPMFATVPADQADAVVALAAADPGVVDARVVAEPAASGRTVVRITPATTVDSEATSDLVHRLRDGLDDAAPRTPASAVPAPRTRPHRRAPRLGPAAPSRRSCSWRSCCCWWCSAAS